MRDDVAMVSLACIPCLCEATIASVLCKLFRPSTPWPFCFCLVVSLMRCSGAWLILLLIIISKITLIGEWSLKLFRKEKEESPHEFVAMLEFRSMEEDRVRVVWLSKRQKKRRRENVERPPSCSCWHCPFLLLPALLVVVLLILSCCWFAQFLCNYLSCFDRWSHQVIYTTDGIVPFILNIFKTEQPHLITICWICLMNLSSDFNRRWSPIELCSSLSSHWRDSIKGK